eukprot:scaffold2149_cov187-Cylindrotheca_fusiformis.AAC.9
MPFARVGVMPQPNRNTQSNMNRKAGNSSSGRQKGITMEDLKRQTALRLAKEQQQRGFHQGEEAAINQQPNNPYVASENLQQNLGYPHTRYPQGETSRDQYHLSGGEVPPQQPYQQQHPYPHSQYPNQETYRPTSYEHYPNSYYGGAAQNFEDSGNAMHYRNPSAQAQEMMNNASFPSFLRIFLSSQQPHGVNNRFRYQPETFPNKLTHGLTVQELKQMTKARLQAEASDTQDANRLSPLDFDASAHEVRERAMSSTSIPSLVQVGQSAPNQSMGRQPRTSPVGFQTFNSKSPKRSSVDSSSSFVIPAHDSWDSGQQQLKLDALETASINSYNNSSVISDNLGSESAYSGGLGSGMLSQTDSDFASIPFNRSLSYTGNAFVPNDGKMVDGKPAPSSASASPASNKNAHSFDAAVGGNRRRSSTLSPNPISIMEDRPQPNGEGLAIPNFSSPGRASLLARPRLSSASSMLSTSQQTENTLFGQSSGMFPFDGPNRPRTQSSVSLPPISHTADDFGGDYVLSHQFVSQGREGPAHGYSMGNNFGENRRRERQVLAPPGFGGNTGYRSVGSGVNTRNSFPSSSIDALSSEMRSILSVSGEFTNRERLNTYPQGSKSNAPEYISEEFFNPDFGLDRL